jgi:hypothetical protein
MRTGGLQKDGAGICNVEQIMIDKFTNHKYYKMTMKETGNWMPNERPDAIWIRNVWHDALDFKNLKSKDNGKELAGVVGGIDNCHHDPEGDATHSMGLFWIRWEAAGMCNNVCHTAEAKNTFLCKDFLPSRYQFKHVGKNSWEPCETHMLVLGALIMLEKAGGPKIPMLYGYQNTKQCPSAHLSTAPDAKFGLNDPDSFRSVFQKLGFSATEQTALMGAHSFADVKEKNCDIYFTGISLGNFCMRSDEAKGKDGEVTYGNHRRWYGWRMGHGWSWGGVFDKTPDQFDNNYFQMIVNEDFGNKDTCCFNAATTKIHNKRKLCDWKFGHRNGTTITRVLEWTKERQAKIAKWEAIEGKDGACAVPWCRAQTEFFEVMQSTMKLHRDHKGREKKIVRFAADWALMGNSETSKVVKTYAQNQQTFFSDFSDVWTKVMRMSHGSELVTCSEYVE